MKCPKCGLDMRRIPVMKNGERVGELEICKNKQCENYSAETKREET